MNAYRAGSLARTLILMFTDILNALCPSRLMFLTQASNLLNSIIGFLRRSKKTILVIVITVALTLLVSAFVSVLLDGNSGIQLPSTGNIHTLGVKVFWDPGLQNQTTQIPWGTVYAGSSYNVTLYFHSTSNVPTFLEKITTDWVFMDSSDTNVVGPTNTTPYMNLDWNYDNRTLDVYQTIQVTLTLTTENSDFREFLISNRITRFSMDVTIMAHEE